MDHWIAMLFLAVLIVAGINAIRTGEVRTRRGGKLKKGEYPLIYWTLVVAQIGLGTLVLLFITGWSERLIGF